MKQGWRLFVGRVGLGCVMLGECRGRRVELSIPGGKLLNFIVGKAKHLVDVFQPVRVIAQRQIG